MPVHQRTIKPATVGGIAGGDKYIYKKNNYDLFFRCYYVCLYFVCIDFCCFVDRFIVHGILFKFANDTLVSLPTGNIKIHFIITYDSHVCVLKLSVPELRSNTKRCLVVWWR